MKLKKSFNDIDLTFDKVDRADEWLFSYSDLVTVLLCFFIMFFVIKAKQQEKAVKESQNKKKVDSVLVSLGQSMESSTPNKKFDLRKLHQHIQVMIKHEHLFTDEELTLDAKYQLAKLADATFKYMPKIQLQISTAVDTRAPASEERSLLRSLKVRSYLESLGLTKDLMTIGSYQGNHERDSDEQVKIVITRNVIEQGSL